MKEEKGDKHNDDTCSGGTKQKARNEINNNKNAHNPIIIVSNIKLKLYFGLDVFLANKIKKERKKQATLHF